MIYKIDQNRRLDIAVGDFVDIQSILPDDYYWGRSFEVISTDSEYPEQIIIRINLDSEIWEDIFVDTKIIVNNFRLISDEEE